MAPTLTWIKTVVCGSILVLAGCTGAVIGQTPTTQFDVPIALKVAYKRALAQTNYCLVTDDNFPVTAQIADDQQTASINVRMSLTGTQLANIAMRTLEPKKTRVTVNMWGVDVWDESAIDAMQAAIEFGVTSCINYFPSAPASEPKRG
jgi:hypothetical protein